jgi:hypothetical protein
MLAIAARIEQVDLGIDKKSHEIHGIADGLCVGFVVADSLGVLEKLVF